jgi:hypothetical protein
MGKYFSKNNNVMSDESKPQNMLDVCPVQNNTDTKEDNNTEIIIDDKKLSIIINEPTTNNKNTISEKIDNKYECCKCNKSNDNLCFFNIKNCFNKKSSKLNLDKITIVKPSEIKLTIDCPSNETITHENDIPKCEPTDNLPNCEDEKIPNNENLIINNKVSNKINIFEQITEKPDETAKIDNNKEKLIDEIPEKNIFLNKR